MLSATRSIIIVFIVRTATCAVPEVTLELTTELTWNTTTGHHYQAQMSETPAPSTDWIDIGPRILGTGTTTSIYTPTDAGDGYFRLIETIPGASPTPSVPLNGGFESGTLATPDNWTLAASQPPARTGDDAHSGSFSLRAAIQNLGAEPAESLVSQDVVLQGGQIVPGENHDFSFWAKQITLGPSYVQQYEVLWLDGSGQIAGSSGLKNFTATVDTWTKIEDPALPAPQNAVDARVRFRFVTGAVEDGHGEVLIDDVILGDASEPGVPETTEIHPLTGQPVSRLIWPSIPGTTYHAETSPNLESWITLDPSIEGDGTPVEIIVPRVADREFYRVQFPSPPPVPENGIVPLFDANTVLESPTTVDTPTALITHIGDRARDRHARESEFMAYDHYLPWYWEERTIAIEIIDRVAKGGDDITVNYTTLTPLGAAEFRAFFRGIGTVAEYHYNQIAELTAPNQYTATITQKYPDGGALQVGDRIELEISQFIANATNGRNNYYGTALLYVVGEGIVPWEGITLPGIGPALDSYPLPESTWLGGLTTLPYQYSNEPGDRFKQTAGNIAPASTQPFMLGRRLHHTDFGDGSHSEPGNPTFSEHTNKLGPRFIARSCIECHTNNGRALPPAIGNPMFQSVVKVGSDAMGSPHPTLGSVLQPRTTSGAAEATASIANYTITAGQYADGTSYSLRKPNYSFSGVSPTFFSTRLAPPLVGLGLLEAVSDSTVEALADPDDSDSDGISGRISVINDPETSDLRLGRFTGKSSRASLRHQIASALNTDMGVTSPVFPIPDGESTAETPEISSGELDEMYRYIALLGVPARRDHNDSQALAGEQLFTDAGCIKCHTPQLTTGAFHPMAELRNQTIRPYTDLLLHDMGSGLADNMGEGGTSGAEWRTPPLWGIGLTTGVSGGEAYLHDGRARTLEEAILWHGGEAAVSMENFRTMETADRAALIKFLKSL